MKTEDGFLRAILEQPAGTATPLVYADWLEEQGDAVSLAKAEYLRLMIALPLVRTKKQIQRQQTRLRKLAKALDAQWLATVSRLTVENCAGKRAEAETSQPAPVRFDYICDRRWEDLQPSDHPEIRWCMGCQQKVHYCKTIQEAQTHAQTRECVVVDLGIIRREGDLQPAPMRVVMGGISSSMQRELTERMLRFIAERERAHATSSGETPPNTNATP